MGLRQRNFMFGNILFNISMLCRTLGVATDPRCSYKLISIKTTFIVVDQNLTLTPVSNDRPAAGKGRNVAPAYPGG